MTAATKTASELRDEAADAAKRLVTAHEEGDMANFHLALGMLWALGGQIYDANDREEREAAP